jgi:hypothetical protein
VVAAQALAQAGHAVYQPPSFANHSQSAPEGTGVNRSSPGSAAHSLPHGYSPPQFPQSEAYIHPELRSSHEPSSVTPVYPPVPSMIPPGPGVPQPNQTVAMSGPAVVAPAVGPVETGEAADGRKAKRELSQSKRAAQNRAAQVSK